MTEAVDQAAVQLDQPMSQERFGALVGVSQQAVSDLVSRGVLRMGQPAQAWLHAYTAHLREQAAGRGADGELARERARLAKENADAKAMENALTRRGPGGARRSSGALLELVLGKLAGDVASVLNGVVPKIRRLTPDLPNATLRLIEAELLKVRERAARVSLSEAEADEEEEES